jgi:membrane protein implicated in regulation of membrane protease activity
MHILFFILAVIALGVIISLVVGVTLKLIGLVFMAVLVVAAVSWTMRKIRGSEAEGMAVLDEDRADRRTR